MFPSRLAPSWSAEAGKCHSVMVPDWLVNHHLHRAQPGKVEAASRGQEGPLPCPALLGPHLHRRRWNAVPARGAGWFTCPQALINGEAAGEQSLKPKLSSLPRDRPDPDASGWGGGGGLACLHSGYSSASVGATCLRGKTAISPTTLAWSAFLQASVPTPVHLPPGYRQAPGGWLLQTGSLDPKYTKNILTNRFCK